MSAFGRLPHPGNKLFMAESYERKGHRSLPGGEGAGKGSHAAWSGNRDWSWQRAAEETTTFEEGPRIEDSVALVPLGAGTEGQPTSLGLEGTSQLATPQCGVLWLFLFVCFVLGDF